MIILLTLGLVVGAFPLSRPDFVGLFDPDTPLDSSLVIPTTRVRTTAHIYRGSTTTGTTISSNPPITSSTSTATSESSTALAVTTRSSTMALATSGDMSSTMAPTFSSVPEAPTTSAEEATQWKVIGIGIITVGLIATVILLVIFFDSWWNFVCDLLCGRWRGRRKHHQGEETLVPDWATRDWEFKLANEEGHRYPTMSSLVDMTEGQNSLKRPYPNAT